jgi:Tfp pilus assembly protein PilN
MRAVNLLPRDDRRSSRKLNPVAVVGIAGTTLVASALTALMVMASGSISSKESELADLQVELQVIPKPAQAQPDNSEALAGEESARVTALSAALTERVAWDRVLRQFALVLPDDVWLTSLNATAPGATPGAAAPPAEGAVAVSTGFAITGYTYSHEAVARLLSRLAVIGDLENVQLQRSAVTAGNSKVVEFTVVASVRKAQAST